jgi:REP element-mobilizing transposase RayT
MRINRLCNTPAQPIWQRGYYEHVIRGDRDLDNIRRYIIGNPTKWEIDEENPETI